MRYNGLALVIEMAVNKTKSPLLSNSHDILILGALREDISYLPFLNRIWEHWSLSHFSGTHLRGGFIPLVYPGAPRKAAQFFKKSVRAYRSGNIMQSMVLLGRASHLLIDMACPCHAKRVAHFTDGYEWYVEAHTQTLKELDFKVPQNFNQPQQIVNSLAHCTQQFEADATNHHFGRLLKNLGLRKPLGREQFALQAEKIIPEAAGHLTAFFNCFLKEIAT